MASPYTDPRNTGYRPPPAAPPAAPALNGRDPAYTAVPPPGQPTGSTPAWRQPGIYNTDAQGNVIPVPQQTPYGGQVTLPTGNQQVTLPTPTGSGPFGGDAQSVSDSTTTSLQPGTSFMNGVDMTQQGAAEKYFSDFGQQYNTRGVGQEYASNVMAQYGNGGTPQVTNNAADVYQSVSGAPGPQNAQDMMGQVLGNQSNQVQDLLAQIQNTPTGVYGQQAYRDVSAPGPGQSASLLAANSGGGPGAAESFLSGVGPASTRATGVLDANSGGGPGAAETFLGGVGPAPTEALKVLAANMGGSGSGNTGAYLDNMAPGTGRAANVLDDNMGPGLQNAQTVFDDLRSNVPANELAQTLGGVRGMSSDTSSYYANAARKAEERIRASNAARGVYGSSGTDDQVRELNMDLAAQEAKDNAAYGLSRAGLEGNLAQGVDAMALQRSGLLGNLGQGIDTASTARTAMLGDLGQGIDATDLQRQGLIGNLTQGMDQLNNQRLTTMGGLAEGIDQNAITRTGILGNLAQGVDQTKNQKLSTLSNLAQGIDQNDVARTGMLGNLAQGVDQTKNQKLSTLTNLAGNIDSDATQRSGILANLGINMDTQALNKLGLQGSLAGNADANVLARQGLAGNLGVAADTATLNRQSLLGNLGSAADQSSLAGSANDLSWMKGIGDITATSDAMGLNKLNAGMNAATAAQGAQTTRGQNAITNQLGYGNALANTMGQSYGEMNENDLRMLTDALTMSTGVGAEGFGQATRNQAQNTANTQSSNDQMMNALKLFLSTQKTAA